MSGIAGIYCLDGRPIDRQDLENMVNSLADRGPDGAEIWCNGAIGFGHRMLWTTPESLLEKLPLTKNGLTITADARIDNRDELLLLLELPDRSPEKITDSEFILAAYEKWGEDCPKQLLGDFSFAIWDQHQQTLFCARDHFGVRPFYYYRSSTLFIFATEIRAIFCSPEIVPQINPERIGDYLAATLCDPSNTSYLQIHRLLPAYTLVVNPTQSHVQPYWKLDPQRELRLESNEEYAAEFYRIFSEAVQCRLRSAFPVGSLLSGGLDSSSVTCVARQLLAANSQASLHTFSAVFDQLVECDERQYIKPILTQGRLEPHYVTADRLSIFDGLQQMLSYHDEPIYTANGFMSWALYAAAQKQAVRVLLSGFDGDSVVSDGYGYLGELARDDRWLTLALEIKELAKTVKISFWGWLWGYIWQYKFKPILDKLRLLRLLRWVKRSFHPSSHASDLTPASGPDWATLLNPEFMQQIDLEKRYQVWQQYQPKLSQDERERHYRTLVNPGLHPFAFEVLDQANAAFGIEPRYPFWDKRLVEFCLALPAQQKRDRGWNRIVMRRAMTNLLPIEVQWRRGKTDFSPHLIGSLLAEQPRLQHVMHHIDHLQAYIDLAAFQAIYQRFVSQTSLNPLQDARLIWSVVSLSLWLRSVAQDQPVELAESDEKEVIPTWF